MKISGSQQGTTQDYTINLTYNIMNILLWIVFGAIAGWVATLIKPNTGSKGLLGNLVIGVVGSFVGGFVFNLFGGEGVTGFNVYSLLVAVVGAIVVLAIVGAVRK